MGLLPPERRALSPRAAGRALPALSDRAPVLSGDGVSDLSEYRCSAWTECRADVVQHLHGVGRYCKAHAQQCGVCYGRRPVDEVLPELFYVFGGRCCVSCLREQKDRIKLALGEG